MASIFFAHTMKKTLVFAIAALAAITVTVWAESPFPGLGQSHARFEVKMEPAQARPGEHVRLIITAWLDEGWHLYSLEPSVGELAPPPTRITVIPGGLVPESPLYETNPLRLRDKVFDMQLTYHEKAVRFYQNLRVPETLSAKPINVSATVQYTTCSNQVCDPPKKLDLAAPLQIKSGSVRPAYMFMERTVDTLDANGQFHLRADSLEEALTGGLLGFLLLAAGFGALSLLTPCVFPMIPLTVSFFAAAKHDKKSTLKLASLFGLGIMGTYTGLGLLLTFLLGAAGASMFASSPVVNLVVGLFFVVFALSLLGAFNIVLPPDIVNNLDNRARHIKGPFGVMLMGVAFTATAFTCTVQFVGTLLIAALKGQVFWPILGMLVFSFVFALPFFLLALFPQYLSFFRGKSGPWMKQVLAVFGVMELMAAMKFISNADVFWGWGIFTRETILASWALGALGIVFLILYQWPRGGMPWGGVSTKRTLVSAVVVAGGVYVAMGSAGKELDAWTEAFMPPSLKEVQYGQNSYGGALPEDMVSNQLVDELPWKATLAEALVEAKKTGKPIFLDFTGYTCVNCRWMEKRVFPHKEVYNLLKNNFVVAKLYTDGGPHAEENQQVQVERFQTLALPFYVVLTPSNAVVNRYGGIMSNPADFAQFLSQGLGKK